MADMGLIISARCSAIDTRAQLPGRAFSLLLYACHHPQPSRLQFSGNAFPILSSEQIVDVGDFAFIDRFPLHALAFGFPAAT